MAEGLSREELYAILIASFNADEAKDLCFRFLGVNYEDLEGDTREARLRSLVAWHERRDSLPALADAIRQARPGQVLRYSPDRVETLRRSILTDASGNVRDAFVEFNRQVETYLTQLAELQVRMEEWKDVHNTLQELQTAFGACRSSGYEAGRLAARSRAGRQQVDALLVQVDAEWRSCRRPMIELEVLASRIAVIGRPYDKASGAGPDWFTEPKQAAAALDEALIARSGLDLNQLSECISIFADAVDRHLFWADKTLRSVILEINRLRRPILS